MAFKRCKRHSSIVLSRDSGPEGGLQCWVCAEIEFKVLTPEEANHVVEFIDDETDLDRDPLMYEAYLKLRRIAQEVPK